MAWEPRRNDGRYYTRSRREGGRVVREYLGGGLLGQLAECDDERRHAEREKKAVEWRAVVERFKKLDATASAASAAAQAATAAMLEAAGYHQHARGEWRRQRRGK